MQHDIFFSISQTPVAGHTPDERTMFANFFEQVVAADEQGFGVAWVAESHLSSEIQKRTAQPVIPHWRGEVGLNVDTLQLAHQIFRRTSRIEVGSAIMNILCMGGPIAAAERVSAFLALHGLEPDEARRLHVGFAAGRFDFMNRASGIAPRNAWEEAAGRALKGRIFDEAAEIFCRLLTGEALASSDVPARTLARGDFRSDGDWQRVVDAYAEVTGQALGEGAAITVPNRWEFEVLKTVPQAWRRELLQLVVGSHDPRTQVAVNQWLPVQVFNLSITRPDVIEQTHARMREAFHPDGGVWRRPHMPRTVFVFLNDEPGLTPASRIQAAHDEAKAALGAYWKALEGTLDPSKVERASHNALIGDPETVARQMVERFHPDDRLMLWFDFFNHDSARVIRNQAAYMAKVVPQVEALLSERRDLAATGGGAQGGLT